MSKWLIILAATAIFVAAVGTNRGLQPSRQVSQRETSPAVPLQVGTNLDAISYWSSAVPFLDLMKSSADWLTQEPGVWDTKSVVDVDPFGWPKSIPRPEKAKSRSLGLIVIRDAGSAAPPRARHVVLYDGQGTLEAMTEQGTEIVEAKPGRLIIRAAEDGSVHLRITASDPDNSNNHIRNIQIVREQFLTNYQNGQMFNPLFVNRLSGFNALRFMEWMATNNLYDKKGSSIKYSEKGWQPLSAGELNWIDRPLLTDARWNRGVPVEAMVELVNQVHAEPWFNMPINASDDYVRGFAKYVQQRLQSDLKVHVELSNEVWNWTFPQAHYAKAKAEQKWGPGASWMEWYGMRAAQVGRIWNEVFAEAHSGTKDPGRVVVVYNTQFAYKGLETPGLETPRWKENGRSIRAADYFDEYAITGYYDAGMSQEENVNQVMSWWRFPNGGFERALSGLRDGVDKVNRPTYSYHAQRARDYELSLVAYEAGYGELTPSSQHENESYTRFLIDIQRRPEMYQLDLFNAEAFHRAGGTLYMNYATIGRPSKWGSYSVLESVDQKDSPRHRALRSLLARSR